MRTWDSMLNPVRWKEGKEDSILTGADTEALVFVQSNDDRSPYKKDFDTVCNSSSIRRLQDKAQVFPLEECDFSRTRLTHSLEVMAIAEALGDSAVKTIIEKEEAAGRPLPEETRQRVYEIPIILRSAALIHDIGNPPFGHISEGVISRWFSENLDLYYIHGEKLHKSHKKSKKSLKMLLGSNRVQDFMNFDGNAQVFRIVTHLQNSIGNRSMNLSYPLLATIIKYPYDMKTGKDGNGNIPKKRGYFIAEQDIYEDIQEKLQLGHKRHPLTYLLEASDDISYLVSDMEDAGKKGLIKVDQLLQKLEEKKASNNSIWICDLIKKIDYFKKMAILRKVPESERETYVMERVRIHTKGLLLSRVREIFSDNYEQILAGTFCKECLDDESIKDIRDALRELLVENVFYCDEIVRNKIKSCEIIGDMLEFFIKAIFNHPVGKMEDSPDSLRYCLLSENYRHYCEKQINAIRGERREEEANGDTESRVSISEIRNQRILYQRLLLLTDHISGMTDSFALRTYKTIFSK